MTNAEEMKSIVKSKYQEIAQQSSSCCGSQCGCSSPEAEVMADSYEGLPGYVPEADLGLGCGIPTEIAGIREGHVVLDLGSGAGNDVFVARRSVGSSGRVIGVDMTEAMVNRANDNKRKLGYTNVEFRLGDIEHLPVDSESVDVVLSNCVLNLVPNKSKAFSEIFRVLKPGGHFSISDIVITKNLPAQLQTAAEMIAGCVAGAMIEEEYLATIKAAGFARATVKKEKVIHLTDAALSPYLGDKEIAQYRESGGAIKSLTVYGEK
jgi:SAM-dependent methyltransferase